jgi:catechol 2,3-dioxygenase-like lactoylglutathione lyase family enzyme
MDTPTFTAVRTVAIPATDLDRTKSLFERLGFETQMDAELQEGFRWIELGPPGAATTLSLVQSGADLPTGIDTGIRLDTSDATAAHAACTDLDLEVGELLDWDTAPLMFSFLDPDGNRFYVTETDAS